MKVSPLPFQFSFHLYNPGVSPKESVSYSSFAGGARTANPVMQPYSLWRVAVCGK